MAPFEKLLDIRADGQVLDRLEHHGREHDSCSRNQERDARTSLNAMAHPAATTPSLKMVLRVDLHRVRETKVKGKRIGGEGQRRPLAGSRPLPRILLGFLMRGADLGLCSRSLLWLRTPVNPPFLRI